ncbi:MAG: hypothetical protein V1778_00560 [bacterium]
MMRSKGLWRGLLLLGLGVGWHMTALAIAERSVRTFPPIDDILLRVLPRVNLFGIGEASFFCFVLLFAISFFRTNHRAFPELLTALGLFYGIRGFFLLLLPIGQPLDAFTGGRLTIYPYASHAFFPGGHIGIMLLMIFFLPSRRLRLVLALFAVLFGIGSLLTRAHYTADLLGGTLLAYAVFCLIGRLHSSNTAPSSGA